MFNKIEEVPKPILSFYHEEVRREPTGNMIEEEYHYVDKTGKDVTSTHLVPEYVENTYVALNQEPEEITFSKVIEVINYHQGNRDDLIDLFLDKAVITEHWYFYRTYMEWLRKCKEVEEYNSSLVPDEDGYTPDPIPLPGEPIYVATNPAQWKLDNFDILRKAAYRYWKEQLEMQADHTWEEHVANVKLQYPKA